MKKNKLQVIILTILICTIVSSAFAQTNLRSIIQGEKGRSANDSRVSVDQKISFIPSQAKAIFGLDNNADLVLKNTEPDQSGYVHYRFFQTWNGVPVENSMYIVHTKNGLLTGMSGSIILDFDQQMAQRSVNSMSAKKAVFYSY